MRTRAMACLRRPVAAPGVETSRARFGSPATEPSDSEVYSVSSGSSVSRTSSFTMSVTCLVAFYAAAGGLLRNLGDLEGDGLLGRVRVLGTAVDLELGELLAGQRVLREHAADGLLDGLLGALGEQLGVGGRPQATREARVAVGLLLLELGAGEGDLVGVDDDDEVTTVDMRGKGGLVLAAQEDRGLAGQATEDHVRRVDDMPGASDLGRLRGEGAQSSVPLQRVGWCVCRGRPRRWRFAREGARHNS